jgi:hypothetical protein
MKLNNMKKTRSVLTGMAALMLVFGLVLAACPGDGGVEDPNPPYGSKVTELNLIGTVTAPVKGAAPLPRLARASTPALSHGRMQTALR